MLDKFNYHIREKKAVKKGALIFKDGYLEFDLNDCVSKENAQKQLSNSVGIAWETENGYYTEGSGIWTSKNKTVESAVIAHNSLLQKTKDHEIFLEKNPFDNLEEQLKKHDWFYHYSDDHRVWSNGEKHWKIIRKLIEQIPTEKVLQLWEKYAPKDWGCPVGAKDD